MDPDRQLRLNPLGRGKPSDQILLPPDDHPVEPDTEPVDSNRSRREERSRKPLVRFDREARSFAESFYFGLRWPGVSVGFREPPYTVEFKYLEDSNDVRITGLRLYHHLLRIEDNNLYWGADMARLSFEGAVSEGNGNSTGLFLGFEKRIVDRFTWSLDVGPYFIHLRDDPTNITQRGLEFTMTTGLNVALF
jgi:hypothetical protein